MKISDIDPNFKTRSVEENADLVSVLVPPFRVYGVLHTEEGFARTPRAVAEAVSEAVLYLSKNTSGGRVRFRTDAPTVTVKYTLPAPPRVVPHMPIVASGGIALYADGRMAGVMAPESYDCRELAGTFTLPKGEGLREIEIYLPLYDGVKDMYVGVPDGYEILPPRPYTYEAPVVLYGSSITQGGCAGRPGNDYAAHLERRLDANYHNLGFAGNARGELAVADYIVTLSPSLVVLDYDHNAPSVEALRETHLAFYRRLREGLPGVPILMVSRPDFYPERPGNVAMREAVRATYLAALSEGDELVVFVDGETLLGERDRDACMVDGIHPNDLGFYRMADVLEPFARELLEKSNA